MSMSVQALTLQIALQYALSLVDTRFDAFPFFSIENKSDKITQLWIGPLH